MDKFLGQPATKPQRPNRTKPKDNKKSTGQMEVESDSQHSQADNPTTAEDLVHILGPLLDQKLAPIKESLTEVLQQVTHHSQRLKEAEDRISTLEDDLDKAQNTIDTQQKEIIILADK
ncbi:hypothetical protein XELAEV_18024640mg, partial [Xenopus laevis]